MGYTIVYSRQFVKTSDSKIVPLALFGSNNVTQYNWRTGKEIRSREWQSFAYCYDMLNAKPEVLMDLANKYHDGSHSENYKYHGKWMDDAAAIRFFKNGIAYAKTIEEIRKIHPAQDLVCYLSIWSMDHRETTELLQSCRTTSALEDWIRQAKVRAAELRAAGKSVDICVGFTGIEPLNCERTGESSKVPEGPVIAKGRSGYVYDCTPDWGRYTTDIRCAKVFASADEARAQLPPGGGPYRFSRAKQKEDALNKKIAIRINGGPKSGLYIKKLCSRSLYFTTVGGLAKLFATEKEAASWVEKHFLTGRFQALSESTFSYVSIA